MTKLPILIVLASALIYSSGCVTGDPAGPVIVTEYRPAPVPLFFVPPPPDNLVDFTTIRLPVDRFMTMTDDELRANSGEALRAALQTINILKAENEKKDLYINKLRAWAAKNPDFQEQLLRVWTDYYGMESAEDLFGRVEVSPPR